MAHLAGHESHLSDCHHGGSSGHSAIADADAKISTLPQSAESFRAVPKFTEKVQDTRGLTSLAALPCKPVCGIQCRCHNSGPFCQSEVLILGLLLGVLLKLLLGALLRFGCGCDLLIPGLALGALFGVMAGLLLGKVLGPPLGALLKLSWPFHWQ